MIWFEVVRVLRRLRGVPRFSAFVIASIGLAVAPILIASSVFEAAFLRDMAVKAPDQLFSIRSARNARGNSPTATGGMSFPDYQELRAALPGATWRKMTAWKIKDVSRATTGGHRPLRIAAISGDYFRIANARFVRGYWPADQEVGVVVTQALWRDLAGGRETAYLTIFNQRYRVTGVVDGSFRGLYPNEGVEAWIALSALPRLEGDAGLLSYRELEDLSVVVETAALIAGLGLYGVASFTTLARRREHGIRAALGASPRQLATLVVSEGLGWTALAAAMSLPFVWVGMKLAATLVIGVRPVPILGTVALIASYFLVALLALTVPALRAASVGPSKVLRSL